ncbi:MAG TPA: hypothetical protein VFJ95_09935 [Gammaproteobacteria bacterium]|nr:hypothetical protein [Gammaproteobacteria bacterium]
MTPACERLARAALALATFAAAACLRTAGAQELAFASAADASAVLGARDAFVERMSPFDRSARLKTDREVTEREYLAFAKAAALDWNDAEKRAVNDAFRAIERELHALELPLPQRVLMVKTTGNEEGNTAYTRAEAIVLPQRMVDEPKDLSRTLAHELFHIASRTQPGFADALYATIGFRPCKEPAYPAELAPRKITNPDAPRNDYCIAVSVDGAKVQVTPILYSRAPVYDPARGGEFFDYLELGFLVVPPSAAAGVVDFRQLSGLAEQIGQNTQYVIHPEEILADNFSLLATGRTQVRSPEVLDRIKRALAGLR